MRPDGGGGGGDGDGCGLDLVRVGEGGDGEETQERDEAGDLCAPVAAPPGQSRRGRRGCSVLRGAGAQRRPRGRGPRDAEPWAMRDLARANGREDSVGL